ncbi:hypothetical protein WBJ53_17270 [Spirosoma sp. SC4-14]|uniref:hypothetical protein n=1 Tax=Spirosoma sp. SC4-14 TaxID=3128900 RepID=UPI0030D4D506
MKIKSLILALPVLCFACGTATDTSDPAYQDGASPILAKRVTGVQMLTSNAIYDNPCDILGEEFVRHTFSLDEKAELNEIAEHDGCAFEWAGNKVLVSFNGRKPYRSIYIATDTFDKLYQGKEAEEEMPDVKTDTGEEATAADTPPVTDTTEHAPAQSHPSPGLTEATRPHMKPTVSQGSYEAVPGLGDKAVWNPTTGAMHVLYINHIINVTVETKGKAEVRKEQAQSMAEVLIEKIAEDEYTRRL